MEWSRDRHHAIGRRMPDSQSGEPGLKSRLLPFQSIEHFHSLHDAPVHSGVKNEYLAIDGGGNVSE